MDGPNWETLMRNGQLVYKASPEHRVMLERFYNFFKGTSDEQIIETKYPEFYAEMKEKESENAKPEESTKDEPTEEIVNDESVVEQVKPRRGRKPSSPKSK